ncbi:MAG TPA: hypothetical protein VH023_11070 [Rhodopila sp.]|nr:hypothetical protein [Rhodopila sp.]
MAGGQFTRSARYLHQTLAIDLIGISGAQFGRDLQPPGAASAPRTSSSLEGHKSPAQFGEKAGRQESISDGTIVAVADAGKIRAGPFEQMAFVQHNPGAFAVETEMLLDGGRQLENVGKIWRRGVSDGNDQDVRMIVAVARGQDNGAGRSLTPSSRPSRCSRSQR